MRLQCCAPGPCRQDALVPTTPNHPNRLISRGNTDRRRFGRTVRRPGTRPFIMTSVCTCLCDRIV